MFDLLPSENSLFHESIYPPQIVHECVVEPMSERKWNAPLNLVANDHLANMSDEELDQDWKLGDFFGTIAVINLPNASQRRECITRELRSIGTDVFEVFTAIDGRKELDFSLWEKMDSIREKINIKTPEDQRVFDRLRQGETGCYMSHYKLISFLRDAFERAKKELEVAQKTQNSAQIMEALQEMQKYSRVLILEDDCGFGIVNQEKSEVSKKGVGKLFRLAMLELPEDWDMLYFMVHVIDQSQEASEHLRKIGRSWFASAYAINYTMYDVLFDTLKQIEDPLVNKVFPVDKAIGEIHVFNHVYAVSPSITFQYPGQSQISGKQRQYIQHQPIKNGK